MDKDKGGTLTAEEVYELLQLLGMKNVRLDDVASKKQQLPYSKADVLRSFRVFADRGAPPGCIVPETLEAALLKHCQHMLDADEISRLVHTLEVQPDGYIHFKDLVQLFMNT
ncbi:hypothetical protein OEZ86_002468 [Tetradesmus obliquus]|nr:hypothetical protein OEZ86_002468 [Tetradesmus obliquus]